MSEHAITVEETRKTTPTRSLLLLVILSVFGALLSVPIGYAGSLLSVLMAFPLAVPQLLSGAHVFWLVLVALMVPRLGSATAAGALKGLIEASLFSHLGAFSFVVSLTEGLVIDFVFAFLKKKQALLPYAAGGLSSASNLIVVQLFLLPSLPVAVFAPAYFAAFLSGLLFGGYLATKVLKTLPSSLKTGSNNLH